MEEVQRLIDLLAARRSTVLITGESGTGKELVARAIHRKGSRAHMPMVAVNCSALPETLLEAELFGHTRGAFTGALQHRAGHFEAAHRGTLFLDEIGEMPLGLQARFLRVLQEKEFQRLGSSDTVRVDVRVIAATNANLQELVEDRAFREDLYYRLKVVPIRLPALRDRAEDIPLLARHFVEKICAQEELEIKEISREALFELKDYSWPGNVRQLENVIEMAVILSGGRSVLEPEDFRLHDAPPPKTSAANVIPFVSVPDEGIDFEKTVSRLERTLLEQALQKTKGNKKRAAEILRLKRTTLSAKLKTVAVC